MNRKGILLTIALVICSSAIAAAAESMSIQASCTIPAIPGVNAPLLTGQGQDTAPAEASLQPCAPVETAPTVRAPKQKPPAMLLAERTEGATLVRTVYSR